MNEALTDADLLDKARRNLRRVFQEAGRHAAELDSPARGPELQLDRGRLALGELEQAAARVLRAIDQTNV